MIKRIDHIAIAVTNLDETVAVFTSLFGLKAGHAEVIADQGVKAVAVHVGNTEIEFIQPIDPNGGVAKFLEKNGGNGIHHIAFEVADTDAELSKLETKGVRLIDKKGRKGMAGKIGFIHPKATGGILTELAQKV